MAYLSDSFIQVQKARPMAELLAYAVRIHEEIEADITADRINNARLSEASALHELFYSHFPASVFAGYVVHVCASLGRPNWLAGRLGVSYHETRL